MVRKGRPWREKMRRIVPLIMMLLNGWIAVYSAIILFVLLWILLFIPLFLSVLWLGIDLFFYTFGQLLWEFKELIILFLPLLIICSIVNIDSFIMLFKRNFRVLPAIGLMISLISLATMVILNPFHRMVPGFDLGIDTRFYVVLFCIVSVDLIFLLYRSFERSTKPLWSRSGGATTSPQ